MIYCSKDVKMKTGCVLSEASFDLGDRVEFTHTAILLYSALLVIVNCSRLKTISLC